MEIEEKWGVVLVAPISSPEFDKMVDRLEEAVKSGKWTPQGRASIPQKYKQSVKTRGKNIVVRKGQRVKFGGRVYKGGQKLPNALLKIEKGNNDALMIGIQNRVREYQKTNGITNKRMGEFFNISSGQYSKAFGDPDNKSFTGLFPKARGEDFIKGLRRLSE